MYEENTFTSESIWDTMFYFFIFLVMHQYHLKYKNKVYPLDSFRFTVMFNCYWICYKNVRSSTQSNNFVVLKVLCCQLCN